MERRAVVGMLASGLTMGSAGCLDGTGIGEDNDAPIEAVERFYEGVVDDDEATIEANYWGDVDRVRQEVGVGIHPLGVGYQEVTDVRLLSVETASLEAFISDRTGRDDDAVAEERDYWEEGLPAYLDDIGVDDYRLVYVEADIEALGETELEVDYLFVVESDGEWYVADMPSTEDVAVFDVGMQAQAFDPDSLTVEAGTEVVWRNTAARMHTVTAVSVSDDAEYFASGGFDSYAEAETAYHENREGSLDSGDQYTHTFEVVGTYEYESLPYAGDATGTIVVE